MKNMLTLLFIPLFFATQGQTKHHNFSAAEQEIYDFVVADNINWNNSDFDAWAAGYVHEPYTTFSYTHPSGVELVTGWEDLAAWAKKRMQHKKENNVRESPAELYNFSFNIGEAMAWVSFWEDGSYSTRGLEKRNGQWKLFTVEIIATTAYKEQEIRNSKLAPQATAMANESGETLTGLAAMRYLIGEWEADATHVHPDYEKYKWVYTPTLDGRGINLEVMRKLKDKDWETGVKVIFSEDKSGTIIYGSAHIADGNTVWSIGNAEGRKMEHLMYNAGSNQATGGLSFEPDGDDVILHEWAILPEQNDTVRLKYRYVRVVPEPVEPMALNKLLALSGEWVADDVSHLDSNFTKVRWVMEPTHNRKGLVFQNFALKKDGTWMPGIHALWYPKANSNLLESRAIWPDGSLYWSEGKLKDGVFEFSVYKNPSKNFRYAHIIQTITESTIKHDATTFHPDGSVEETGGITLKKVKN